MSQAAVRISGVHVEGFGVYRDFELKELPDGLVVFHGPNEAGKSTLLAFLRGVLFGFPRGSRKVPRYEPRDGGVHGGSVTLATLEGEVAVHRTAGRRRLLMVTLPDGSRGDEDDLHRVLGGADPLLYESVFAFGLQELASFEALGAKEITDRIFSAGIAGAGRSAREALRLLEAGGQELLRPRSEQGRLNQAWSALQRVEADLGAARASAQRFGELSERRKEAAKEVGSLRAQRDEAASERARLQRRIDLWPSWSGLGAAREEIRRRERERAKAPPLVRPLRQEIERAARELPAQGDHAANEARIGAAVARASEAFEARLHDLGPGWDPKRLRGFEAGIEPLERARELAREHARLEAERIASSASLPRDRSRLDEQTRALAALDAEHASLTAPDDVELDREAAALRDLAGALEARARRTEQIRREVADEEEVRRAAVARGPGRALVAGWGVATVVAAAGSAFALVAGPSGLGAALGFVLARTVAVACAAAFFVARRDRSSDQARLRSEADRLGATRERRRYLEREDEMHRVEIAGLATAVGLAGVPDPPALAARAQQHEEARATARRRAAVEARRSEVARQNDAATASLERSEREAALAEEASGRFAAQFGAWCEAQGLDPSVPPESAPDLVASIRSAKDLLHALRRSQAERAHLRDQVIRNEEQMRQLLARSGTPVEAEASPQVPFEALAQRCEREREDDRRLAELRERELELEAQLTAGLGTGKEAEQERTALGRGALSDWRREHAECGDALETLDRELEAAVRRHESSAAEHERLARAHDIPALSLERGRCRAVVDEAVERWLELGLARSLIQRSLEKFERTRQPDVLREASRHFEQVTAGRYRRVVQDSERGGVAVVDAADRRLAPDELSRGTAEQLYLCVRFGLVAEFARRSAALPIIVDDAWVNFDPERAASMAEVLAELSNEHQILFFTCHPNTVRCLEATGAVSAQVPMRRRGGAD